jgi:hypothetical protein
MGVALGVQHSPALRALAYMLALVRKRRCENLLPTLVGRKLKRSKFYIKETDLKSMKGLLIDETYLVSCQWEILEITAQKNLLENMLHQNMYK